MGFAFDGVEIDLMYCQLHLQIIPDEFDIFDNNIFKNMEYKSVRSLCGTRLAFAFAFIPAR
jgi:poly(A) polymerase Pap1